MGSQKGAYVSKNKEKTAKEAHDRDALQTSQSRALEGVVAFPFPLVHTLFLTCE
jgi:hypothetical protein